MSTNITIYPDSQNLSPYQVKMPHAPTTVNDNFLGSFADILDLINPLQHIPGVSTVYQAITGDKPSAGAQIIGGAIFGGPLGFIASIANAIIEQETGKDVAQNVFAAVTDNYQKASTLS